MSIFAPFAYLNLQPTAPAGDPNLLLWLDAGDVNSYVSGTDVWYGLSDTGYSMPTASGYTSGYYNANSGGYVEFSNAEPGGTLFTQIGWTDLINLGDGDHTIIVFQTKRTDDSEGDLIATGPIGGDNSILLMNLNSDPYYVRTHLWNTGTGVSVIDSGVDYDKTKWYMYTHRVNYTSGTLELLINTGSIGTASSVSPGSPTTDQFNIGGRSNTGGGFMTEAGIGVVKVWDKALDDGEIEDQYLEYKTRFGLD
jgi:hypothetical protein